MSWKIVILQNDKQVAERESSYASQAVATLVKARDYYTSMEQPTVIKMLDPQDKLVISVEVANLAPSQ